MPDPTTVSNSSALIALESIGRMDLLRQLYGTVMIPPAVYRECTPLKDSPMVGAFLVRSSLWS